MCDFAQQNTSSGLVQLIMGKDKTEKLAFQSMAEMTLWKYNRASKLLNTTPPSPSPSPSPLLGGFLCCFCFLVFGFLYKSFFYKGRIILKKQLFKKPTMGKTTTFPPFFGGFSFFSLFFCFFFFLLFFTTITVRVPNVLIVCCISQHVTPLTTLMCFFSGSYTGLKNTIVMSL